MNLNNNASDLKIYTRNKYSDGLPFTSSDIHQERDLALRKLGLIMDNLVGSTLLEKVHFSEVIRDNVKAVRLSKPTPVNLNGDVFLIGSSENSYPLELPNNFTGSIVLICWYTNVTANSVLYEYGGLCNNTMENDLLNKELSIQTSSRYQVRWNLGYVTDVFDYSNPSVKTITITSTTTEAGNFTGLILNESSMNINGKFYVVPQTSKIPSADGFVYMIPLANVNGSSIKSCEVHTNLTSIESTATPKPTPHKVWYNPETDEVKMYFNGEWRNVGGSQIIRSETEPQGSYKDGTIWYDPTLNEFKFYLEGLGFVATHAKIGFVQLQATHTFVNDIATPQNITVNIPIDSYLSSDILRVTYEGIELIKGVNYTVNNANKTVTLQSFTINAGETMLFTVTRLVSSSDLVTTLDMLENHINDIGNSTVYAHLKLSDTLSDQLDETKGVAATPKSVKLVNDKVNKYEDQTTGSLYELGINNGLLFIREVNN